MPKAKAQKRYKGGMPTAQSVKHTTKTRVAEASEEVLPPRQEQRSVRPTVQSVLANKNRSGSTQALVMSGMLAVGCWGLAFTFIFLTTTQNHVLLGGMIAVIAAMWSYSFALRLRKARR